MPSVRCGAETESRGLCLRTRGGYGGDEGRFAGIREADEPDIGQELEFKAQMFFFARGAVFEVRRHAVRRCGKMTVAASAMAAVRNHDAFSVGHQIGQNFSGLLVVNHRADGKFDGDGFSAASAAMGGAAVPAVFRLVMFSITKIEQRRQPVRGGEDDVAAISAVTAVRPAARDKHLPPEASGPVAASSGFYKDLYFVDKHGISPSESRVYLTLPPIGEGQGSF